MAKDEFGEVRFWSVREACDAIQTKKISAVEYVTEILEGCRAHEDLNAFITLDEDASLKAAAERDAAANPGVLNGLPIAVKDAVDVAGFPTTAGTEVLRNHFPEKTAEVMETLIDAGAIVVGKQNMHEMSYGITSNNGAFGTVRNPYNRDRIAGGSSGGTGASVAAGLVPAAFGTDTGGSVRIPASLSGVVGFRPSIHRYSQDGLVPMCHSRDTIGPLTRSVDDAAFLDSVVMKKPDDLETISPKDIRLGIPQDHFLENLTPEAERLFNARIADLKGAGFQLVDVAVKGIEPPLEACGFPIGDYETMINLAEYFAGMAPDGPTLEEFIEGIKSPDVERIVRNLFSPDFEVTKEIYDDATQNRRPRLQKVLNDSFEDNSVDALIFPTTPIQACKIGEDFTTIWNGVEVPTFSAYNRNTDPGSTAGIPGISIPAGLTEDGLPIGIAIDGPYMSDRRLLAVGAAIEKEFPAMPRP